MATITVDDLKQRIKRKVYCVTYEEAIDIGDLAEVKYLWNKNDDDEQYLRGIILKQIDGLILEVKY